MEQTRGLFCTCSSDVARCQSQTPVTLQSNELAVQSVFHGHVRLVAVNQICVVHEAINGCKNLKIY